MEMKLGYLDLKRAWKKIMLLNYVLQSFADHPVIDVFGKIK